MDYDNVAFIMIENWLFLDGSKKLEAASFEFWLINDMSRKIRSNGTEDKLL